MQIKKSLPEAVVRRLPGYHRYLCDLCRLGTRRISSQELAKLMGLTASQIRQDFNSFGGVGQQGYGYNTDELRDRIAELLGLGRSFSLILVGAGNIGQALIKYAHFAELGLHIVAAFDTSPRVVEQNIGGIVVKPIEELTAHLAHGGVDIAIVAVPAPVAQDTANLLIDAGITALWNFAPVDLQVPPHVHVVNVHMLDSLLVLLFRMNAAEK